MKYLYLVPAAFLTGMIGIIGASFAIGLLCRLIHLGWSLAWTPL